MAPSNDYRRPPYPALTTSSSTFQNSSNSINSAHSTSSHGSTANMSTSPNRGQSYNAAPLPSPTTEQETFFGSMSHSMTQNQQSEAVRRNQLHQQQLAAEQLAAMQQYQQYQQQEQMNQQQAYQNQQNHAQGNYTYQPNRQGSGSTAGETNAYINNYALIAEAAKRAQMAVLERDFGGVDLS